MPHPRAPRRANPNPNPSPNPDPSPNPNPNPNEPQGALLKGVIDETGLLRGGEIFIQIAHARAGHGVGRDTATYYLLVTCYFTTLLLCYFATLLLCYFAT